MKKIILPLLLSIFFHAAFAQEDEGVEIGGTSLKKVKFKPLQTGRMVETITPALLRGSVEGIKPNLDILNGLKAKVTGLNIAVPDSSNIIIRRHHCLGSFQSAQLPLYVINGIPVPEGNRSLINPDDITSIDIIKGQEAMLIYGSSAKGGVVVIKTKFETLRIQVMDSVFKQPLSYAFIDLDFYKRGKKNERLVADDSGYCSIPVNLLKDISSIQIKYSGYHAKLLQPFSLYGENGARILLQKKEQLPQIIVVTKAMTVVRSSGYNCFEIKTSTLEQDLNKALQGRFGCYEIVRDTVPGKVTFPIQARPFVFNEERLIVIDGIPVADKKKDIPGLDKIGSVDILKANSLPPIGCGPRRDVVIITTKPVQVRTQVTDRVSGQPVPNASVQLVFKQKNKPGKTMIADSAGYFTVEDKLLSMVSGVYVTSVGYYEKILLKENTGSKIMLERRPNKLTPVIVVQKNSICRRLKYIDCILSVVKSHRLTAVKEQADKNGTGLFNASVFPNPVSRGNALHVRVTAADNERLNVALLSVSGQPVYQANHATNKGANQVSIQLPQQISAGVYMLVAKNEQGKMLLNRSVVVE